MVSMDMIRSLRMIVLFLGIIGCGTVLVFADEPEVIHGASVVGGPVTPTRVDVDLREIPVSRPWRPGDPVKEVPRQFSSDRGTPGAVAPGFADPLVDLQRVFDAPDDRGFTTPAANFPGQGFTGINPPDPVGDVGPEYYIQSINGQGGSLVTVYEKDGTVVAGPFDMDMLGSGHCAQGEGDPIVLYDRLAGRWVLQEFVYPSPYLCFYVSQTSDPVSGGWYAYTFQTENGPDYPHIGVWTDAYYTTTNEHPSAVYAFDRQSMLSGATARPLQRFELSDLDGYNFQAATPADLDGPEAPPTDAPGIIMRHVDDEAHSGYADDPATDLLEMFAFQVDWDDSGNSVLESLPDIVITDFNSWFRNYTTFAVVPQPGTSSRLDPIREVILNRLQYRNFGDYETLVGVLPTNIDPATSGEHVVAGQRWFELRRVGGGDWALFQEGTFHPGDDSENRFVGSVAMDQTGNVGLAYSFTDLDPAVEPSLYYTGRLVDDPLGIMSQEETAIVDGSGVNSSGRWGDYASMNVDPEDDCTFWFTGQYQAGSWGTHIGAFRFEACGCDLELDQIAVTAAAPAPNTVEVQWTDSLVPEISEYLVYRSRISGGPYELMATVSDTSPGVGGGAGYVWSDTDVSGSIPYFYIVRFSDGATCVSDPSEEATVVATGLCLLPPIFAGVGAVENPGEEQCSLDVSWNPGVSECGNRISYNVYRSLEQGFQPGPQNLVATSFVGLSFRDDQDLTYNERSYYVVRAVDAGNGVEDDNTVEDSARPTGVLVVSDWSEDVDSYADMNDARDAGWTTFAAQGTDDWDVLSGDDHTSGTGGVFAAENVASVTDKWLQSDAVGITASSQMSFWHRYDIEEGYDGSVIEISIDGGASWEDLGPHILAGLYDGEIESFWGNPLGGREGWTGLQSEYVEVVVDLSGFAGETVRLRWRMGCDQYQAAGLWEIDDILVSEAGVAGPCETGPAGLFGDGFESGDTSAWSSVLQ